MSTCRKPRLFLRKLNIAAHFVDLASDRPQAASTDRGQPAQDISIIMLVTSDGDKGPLSACSSLIHSTNLAPLAFFA
jgi:hypothetical protein